MRSADQRVYVRACAVNSCVLAAADVSGHKGGGRGEGWGRGGGTTSAHPWARPDVRVHV